ncbi:elongation factor EF-1 alpha subunit [Aureobasidium melanogenum CBS 110374]|uniref:Elongation factor 1 alpha-like protein n=1 Tax=Aureobasidium melanogenum (strain CBS 110374) TaxID=1043003 RepID=A0A074WGK1_AURM1|nr:elongation factor EF-1 alpha subunit [Aureobasidium melanogenum CBS 110374]KEQ61591.1 elongation factor EF-1 alpha subunit [Aureobasidium melanogenum CBS 110374]
MAHRRVKEIDYDEDEYDDYYSGEEEYGYEGADNEAAADTHEDELSAEDKEQMRIGTQKVRAALGDVSEFITDEAIQEALWHYYYDVAKSVTYLKNQNAPQQAQPKEKKQKPVSKFDQAATSAAQKPVEIKGPSPDDIVMQAQAKASGAKKQASQQKDSKFVTNGVSSLSLEEPQQTSQKVKSKNLDVLAEHAKAGRKNAASFVVIGHVDHGKSTLMGRLLYDLKVVDQRSLDKYRKEATSIGKLSFALAWVMDSTSEERERGVTVDIATNNFETEKTKFTILDAPGHRDFIPNMIAGASQADFAVLVIDAGTNSFEAGLKGQTREHAQLVRSMGVQRIIVAINKMDSINWAQERFEEIQQQISAFLTTTGFQQKNIAFIPCSGLTGENVVTPAPEAAAWYTKTPSHQTLIQALEAHEPTKAALSSPFRLPISDIFRGGVQNPLSISGRIEAGTCQVGDSLIAMPANETCSIKGIEVDNAAADWAVAGQIVTLHLTEIDPVHLRIADLLCDARKPVANVKSFTTKILAFEHVLPMTVDVHRGRMHVPGRISSMVCVLDKSSGNITKKKPRVVQPGSVARVKVELDTAVPLEVPGRIVLRSGGNTVAAGLLEEVHA